MAGKKSELSGRKKTSRVCYRKGPKRGKCETRHLSGLGARRKSRRRRSRRSR